MMKPLRRSSILALPSQVRSLLVSQPTFRRTFISALSNQILASSTASQRSYATAEAPNPASTIETSSVNQTEVSHFSSLASAWWDPHGSSRLLHLMNPLRHDFIRRCLAPEIRDPAQKFDLLDIGCGGGIFAESAARLPTIGSVTAIDPTPECIAVAERHKRADPLLLEPGRLTYLNTSIEELSQNAKEQTPKQFDIISLFEVIEHIQQPSPFLRSILTHLKPGGWLVGSTIARTPVSWFTTKFIAEDVLRMVPRGTHDWNQYIQPQEMREWARSQQELSTSDGLGWQVMGVVYVPGVGWKEVSGSEAWGNYFFGVKKREDAE